VSVSFAELLDGLVSVTPSGAATEAEFVTAPIAPAAIDAVIEYVTDPPTGRSTLLLIAPLPAAGQTAPAAPVHVQLIEVTLAGTASVTVAPVTVDGPKLLTTTV